MILNELVLLAAALIMFPVFLYVFVSELNHSSWNKLNFKQLAFVAVLGCIVFFGLGVWL